MKKCFGLLGKKLTHSFSKNYFTALFEKLNLQHYNYELFEFDSIPSFFSFLNQHTEICGFNVTIPYKESIVPFLSALSPQAKEVAAVNCVKKEGSNWIGHNTDGPAFLNSLSTFLPKNFAESSLIIGNGGASKAVQWALKQRNLPFQIVQRTSPAEILQIPDSLLKINKLIINTTPLGMSPNIRESPLMDYSILNSEYYLYDLIYNPKKTLFLSYGMAQNSHCKNGLEMLYGQADLSWDFWQNS